MFKKALSNVTRKDTSKMEQQDIRKIREAIERMVKGIENVRDLQRILDFVKYIYHKDKNL